MFGLGISRACVWVAILVICKSYFSSCCLDKTGIRLRATNNCLQYAKEVGIAKLERQLQGSTLRDNSGTVWGSVHYTLSKIRILSDHGSFEIKGEDLQFSVTVRLGAKNGRPTISAEHCSASAGSVSVKFHGGARLVLKQPVDICKGQHHGQKELWNWLYNLFRGGVENSIKDSFQDMVCKGVRRSIDVNAARQLATFDVNGRVGEGVTISYSLVRNPLFTSQYMDVLMKGQFQSSRYPQVTPFCPRPPLPRSWASEKMLYIWLSDYVLNSAARVYHKEGLLRQTITAYRGKGGRVRQLDTNSLRYLVIQLAKRFPNRPAKVNLYTTQPPFFKSSALGIKVTFVGNGEFLVKLANGTLFNAFTLKLFIATTMKFQVKNDRLTGSVSNFRINLSVHESFIGNIKTNIKFFNGFFKPFFKEKITKKINKYGAIGTPLPVMGGVHFINTKLSTGNRFILVETDAKYIGRRKPRM